MCQKTKVFVLAKNLDFQVPGQAWTSGVGVRCRLLMYYAASIKFETVHYYALQNFKGTLEFFHHVNTGVDMMAFRTCNV